MSLLPLPHTLVPFLAPWLPTPKEKAPFVTLTWAQSLDARIAAEPGVQTKISHAETKIMTHYLRSKHDAILVGVGTVVADDPKLNCRYGQKHIRPVVVDPHARWKYSSSQLRQVCESGAGLAPYIIVGSDVRVDEAESLALTEQGGEYVALDLGAHHQANWEAIFQALHVRGVSLVMVEGGAKVINTLLAGLLVDSVVVTIGPVFLGDQGVEVSPRSQRALKNVKWWTGTTDSVVAGTVES